MCETTRAIEKHPKSQRQLLKIREVCERLERQFREWIERETDSEEPDALAK